MRDADGGFGVEGPCCPKDGRWKCECGMDGCPNVSCRDDKLGICWGADVGGNVEGAGDAILAGADGRLSRLGAGLVSSGSEFKRDITFERFGGSGAGVDTGAGVATGAGVWTGGTCNGADVATEPGLDISCLGVGGWNGPRGEKMPLGVPIGFTPMGPNIFREALLGGKVDRGGVGPRSSSIGLRSMVGATSGWLAGDPWLCGNIICGWRICCSC